MILLIIFLVVLEVILPGNVALVLAILNMIIPDPIPYVDEIIGIVIAIAKLIQDE